MEKFPSSRAAVRMPVITATSETHFRKIGCGVLVIAIASRVIWGMLVTVVPVSDGKAYDILAHTLVEHGVYGWSADQLSAFWPPGTSAVYAALYSAFGYSFTSIVAFNVVCSTAI